MPFRVLQHGPYRVEARDFDLTTTPPVFKKCDPSYAMFFSGHAETIAGTGSVKIDLNDFVCAKQTFVGNASFVATPMSPDAPAITPPPILIADINGPVVVVRAIDTTSKRVDTAFSWHCEIEVKGG